jgi:phage terminase large subunit
MPDTPQDVGTVEWIEYRFKDINDDDLFWIHKNTYEDNKPFRKVGDAEALNLRDMRTLPMDPNRLVYQKEW